MDGPELGHRGWPRFHDCFSSCIPLGSNSPSPGVPAQGNSRNFHFEKEGVFDHVCLRCAEISKPGGGKLRSLCAPNDTIRYSAESKHRSLLSTSQIFGNPPNLPSWFSSPNCWQSLIGTPNQTRETLKNQPHWFPLKKPEQGPYFLGEWHLGRQTPQIAMKVLADLTK